MITSSLDEREVQLLIVALRYWRTHRNSGLTRRTDPHLTPDTVDILLAKLASSTSPVTASERHHGSEDAGPDRRLHER